jgi:hypothetical protein
LRRGEVARKWVWKTMIRPKGSVVGNDWEEGQRQC